MREQDVFSEQFEALRGHLRAIAYRMLGSISEADDAVQETWLRLSRSDTSEVENLRAWLTTVISRICLNMLRSRKARRESSLEAQLPDPILSPVDVSHPEQEVLRRAEVGLALMVVLDTLSPGERVAFVLHDIFSIPFDAVARILGKSPEAARQLASRARRRVHDAPVPDTDVQGQRAVLDAFVSASRNGDFERLLSLLDPDVVLHSDGGAARPALTEILRGAHPVAARALMFRHVRATPALINGVIGGIGWTRSAEPFVVLSCTIKRGKIVTIEVLVDPERVGKLDMSSLGPGPYRDFDDGGLVGSVAGDSQATETDR
jgi:RNA polymerase sigma factor (sigma-70 family)